MAEVINKYETIFVLDVNVGDEKIEELTNKFQELIQANGEVESVDVWGKRRLAYPIDYKTEGYYVLVNFKSEGSFTSELERLFGINENILRSIVIRLIEDKKTKKEA